ncbi:hypothetical protein [Methylobacterium oryzihabitans]|uniref:Uncharacterized protein n=1 Tax=Methylobacterium oryzihabitans TaxID=2499852 RepID=A0A3S2W9X9_9HYPH|nr:hypothetical protein [Methylobacterium oryzihabitans]RVU17483.1 hypothetical protein EOE48_13935 [Methylobacterium oryzihabitans]
MSDALAVIEARIATLQTAREMLEYADSFEFWGLRSRQIDAELATLAGQRDGLIRQRQQFNGCEGRLGGPMLAKGRPSA